MWTKSPELWGTITHITFKLWSLTPGWHSVCLPFALFTIYMSHMQVRSPKDTNEPLLWERGSCPERAILTLWWCADLCIAWGRSLTQVGLEQGEMSEKMQEKALWLQLTALVRWAGLPFLTGIDTESNEACSQHITAPLCHSFCTHFPDPAWVLPRLQSFRINLLWQGSSSGCRGISAPVPGAPPPSLTLVAVLLFLTASPHCLSSSFYPFLRKLSQRHHHTGPAIPENRKKRIGKGNQRELKNLKRGRKSRGTGKRKGKTGKTANCL